MSVNDKRRTREHARHGLPNIMSRSARSRVLVPGNMMRTFEFRSPALAFGVLLGLISCGQSENSDMTSTPMAGTAGLAGTSSGAAGAVTNSGGGAGAMDHAGAANAGAEIGGATAGGAAAGASAAGASGVGGATAGTSNGGSATVGGSGAGGASAGGAGGAWTFPTGVTKPKIMIVGDSISAGPGCYKKYLLKNLTDNHYSRFEFVGQYTDDCGGGVKHSAVSCSTAEQFTHPTFTMPNCSQGITFSGMSTLMTTIKPDLVMLQLGVNDVWGGKSVVDILGNYTKLVQQARAQNPNVVLVVAQIAKMNPSCSSDGAYTKQGIALDNAVPDWAKTQTQANSPVFVADLWSNSDPTMAETLDCVHPNDVGAQKMGKNWFNALKSILTPN